MQHGTQAGIKLEAEITTSTRSEERGCSDGDGQDERNAWHPDYNEYEIAIARSIRGER